MDFLWSSELSVTNGGENEFIDEYTIIFFTDTTDSTNETYHTSNTSLTLRLEVNKTYSVILYASRCNRMLISDPFITNITIGIASLAIMRWQNNMAQFVHHFCTPISYEYHFFYSLQLHSIHVHS